MTGGRRGFLLGLGAATLAGPAAARKRGRRRVRLTPDAVEVIEGAHALGDVTFEVAADFSGDRVGLEVAPGAEIDVLRIRVPPGVTWVERLLGIGAGARIGVIDVAAAEQVSGRDDKLDGFVQIRGDDVRIEAMRFLRIDRCLSIHEAARVSIGAFDCESYCKGIRIHGCQDVHVGRLGARVASPFAVPDPGFNGLTISDSRRVDLPRVEIEDAAEHAVYIAGGGGEEHSEAIRLGQVTTRRSGQCGVKCKAPLSPSVDVSIERLEVVDAAFRSRPNRNEDALRVENAKGVRVGRLDARREEGRVSCYAGVYLDGVEGFALEGGHIDSPAGPMVMIGDGRGRPNSGILIRGLSGSRLRSHGYLITHSRGQALEGLVIEGGRLDGVAGDVVRVEGNARLPPGSSIEVEAAAVRGERLAAAPGAAVPELRIEAGGARRR